MNKDSYCFVASNTNGLTLEKEDQGDFYRHKPGRFIALSCFISCISLLLLMVFSTGLYANNKFPFNWEKYYENLENVYYPAVDMEEFINQLGAYQFGNTDVNYCETNLDGVLALGINDENPTVRLKCIYLIKERHLSDFVPKMVERLSIEEELSVKKQLIWAIGHLGSESEVLPLTQYLRRETNTELQSMLALALGRLGGTGDEVGPLLYLAENSSYFYVKCAAILGIGRLELEEGKEILRESLNHRNKEVRFTAVLALTFLPTEDPEITDKIYDLFAEDNSIYVNIVSSFYLLKWGGYNRHYGEYLVSWIRDPVYQYPALDFIMCLGFRQFLWPLKNVEEDLTNLGLRMQINAVIAMIEGRH